MSIYFHQSQPSTQFTVAKGSIPLYSTYNTGNGKKHKSDSTEDIVKKELKSDDLEQYNVKKCKAHMDVDLPKKKMKLLQNSHFDQRIVNEPRGIIWDGENYSCAYDALFSLLWNIWLTEPAKWTLIFAAISERMKILGEGFEDVEDGILPVERLRNNIQQDLHHQFPDIFPYGYQGTSVVELVTKMFHNEQTNASSQLQCTNCDFCDDLIDDKLSPVIHGTANISATVKEQLQATLVTPSRQVCPECLHPLRSVISYNHFPKLLIFTVGGYNIEMSKYIKITTHDRSIKLYLRGIVYF